MRRTSLCKLKVGPLHSCMFKSMCAIGYSSPSSIVTIITIGQLDEVITASVSKYVFNSLTAELPSSIACCVSLCEL